MATSPVGSVDLHDWRRIGELFLQGFVAWLIPQSLTIIPLLNWGQLQPLEMILVLVLTEAGKRYMQAAPVTLPIQPTE